MGLYDNKDFKEKREYVMNAYSGYSWKWKVEHMKPGQILAIWDSLQRRANKKREACFKQISLFDLYPDAMTGGKLK